MKHYRIAERYASGLSAAITDDAQLEPVANGLRTLGKLIRTNHELKSALLNPSIRQSERLGLLDALLDRLGISGPGADFCRVVMRRKRFYCIPDIARIFSTLADERLNQVGVEVTTTAELSEAQAQQLKTTLETFSGKTVHLDTVVDPGILGGVIARMGSTVIDGSVKSRLSRLRNTLLPEENVSG